MLIISGIFLLIGVLKILNKRKEKVESPSQPVYKNYFKTENIKPEMEVVQCQYCGAENTKAVGTHGVCEYCGSSL
jgi:hypothetical protein